MLKDKLFTITDTVEIENGTAYRLSLNAEHAIFKAHFAGSPVLPGACIVQTVKELAELQSGLKLFISEVKNTKFLSVINPEATASLTVVIEAAKPNRSSESADFQPAKPNRSWRPVRFDDHNPTTTVVSAVFKDGETVFSKVSLVLLPQPQQQEETLAEKMKRLKICVLIPTYNNCATIEKVINNVLLTASLGVKPSVAPLRHCERSEAISHIETEDCFVPRNDEDTSEDCFVPRNDGATPFIIVNDGSTDETAAALEKYRDCAEIISYSPNRGKGYALKKGFDRAEQLGFEAVITLDSDGQHPASGIASFVEAAEQNPDAFLLGQRTIDGVMPAGNSFANRFSNFWFAVQTARRLQDTQNGFRLYPLAAMKGLRPLTNRYEAELEMLVRAAWKGIKIVPVPVNVYYPPANERVTHFRPFWDFFRISVLNTVLTLLAIVYGYPSMFYHKISGKKR